MKHCPTCTCRPKPAPVVRANDPTPHEEAIDWITAKKKQGLPTRAAHALCNVSEHKCKELGVPYPMTLDDLEQWRMRDLMLVKNLGRDTAYGVRDWMRSLGRRLKGDTE